MKEQANEREIQQLERQVKIIKQAINLIKFNTDKAHGVMEKTKVEKEQIDRKLKESTEKTSKLEDTYKTAKRKFDDANAERTELETRMNRSHTEFEDAERESRELDTHMKDKENELGSTEQKLGTLRQQQNMLSYNDRAA